MPGVADMSIEMIQCAVRFRAARVVAIVNSFDFLCASPRALDILCIATSKFSSWKNIGRSDQVAGMNCPRHLIRGYECRDRSGTRICARRRGVVRFSLEVPMVIRITRYVETLMFLIPVRI